MGLGGSRLWKVATGEESSPHIFLAPPRLLPTTACVANGQPDHAHCGCVCGGRRRRRSNCDGVERTAGSIRGAEAGRGKGVHWRAPRHPRARTRKRARGLPRGTTPQRRGWGPPSCRACRRSRAPVKEIAPFCALLLRFCATPRLTPRSSPARPTPENAVCGGQACAQGQGCHVCRRRAPRAPRRVVLLVLDLVVLLDDGLPVPAAARGLPLRLLHPQSGAAHASHPRVHGRLLRHDALRPQQRPPSGQGVRRRPRGGPRQRRGDRQEQGDAAGDERRGALRGPRGVQVGRRDHPGRALRPHRGVGELARARPRHRLHRARRRPLHHARREGRLRLRQVHRRVQAGEAHRGRVHDGHCGAHAAHDQGAPRAHQHHHHRWRGRGRLRHPGPGGGPGRPLRGGGQRGHGRGGRRQPAAHRLPPLVEPRQPQ
jgi:hypothetical protein